MPELPHDVWRLITSLLEVTHLLTLAGVNRSFYNIILDTRYGEIHWIRIDDNMLKALLRLQDPFIAQRVRRIHIRAWFIQYLVSSGPSPQSQTYRFKQWTSTKLATVTKIFTPSSASHPPRDLSMPKNLGHSNRSSHIRVTPLEDRLRRTLSVSSDAASTTPSSLIPLMSNAFQRMTNLTEYDFEWRDLSLTNVTMSFLPSNTTALSSLRKLVLHAQLPQFRDLLSQFMLKSFGIQDLELYFDYNPPSVSTAPTAYDTAQTLTLNETILATSIAPFILSLRSSLSSLKITSVANGDHAHLFDSLGSDRFPHLHILAVRIPFCRENLSGTDGLVRLLQMHAGTLLHVELRPTGAGETTLSNGGPWSHMSRTCVSPTFPMVFANLESLTIPILEVRTTLELVKRSAYTLKCLCLLGKVLDEDELREVISVFDNVNGGRLRRLVICVSCLTPGLMGLLVAGLPALLSLALVLKKVHTMPPSYTLGELPKYDWGLYDLSIYLGRIRDVAEVVPVADMMEGQMMTQMLDYLPSVRSFKQQGHCHY